MAFISGQRPAFLETLKHLRDLGNTLIVVEHDEDTMRAADFSWTLNFGRQQAAFCEEHLLLTVPARFAVNETMKNYALTASDIREERHLNSRIPPVSLEHFRMKIFCC